MVSNLLSLLLTLKAKAILWGGIALGALAILWKIRHDGEVAGAQKLQTKIDDVNKKVENEWKTIDRSELGVDDALGRLRARSTKAGYTRHD